MSRSTRESSPGGPVLSKACDHCRSRKIRCDKLQPCSNCRSAGINCVLTDLGPQEPRQRVLISNQYEKKIDAIESRLDGIEKLLRELVINKSSGSAASPSVAYPTPSENQAEGTGEDKTSSKHFESESSLTAHSKHARWTLESLLLSNPAARYDPAVASALSSLREMMQKQEKQSAPRSILFKHEATHHDDPSYPPFQDVMSMLRDSKGYNSFFLFFLVCPYLPLSQFIEMCEDVYYRPNSASLANHIVVNGGLHYAFSEYVTTNPNCPQKFKGYPAQFCKNFELYLSRFQLLAPPTFENVLALTLVSGYATHVADYSLCFTSTSAAVRMVQMLGWHRLNVVNEDSQELANKKKMLFWDIYYYDKSLSLRMGRSSMLQDFDISLDLPEISLDPQGFSWRLYMHAIIDLATIHGQVYERLYSPGASSHTVETKNHNVQELAERVMVALPRGRQILEVTSVYQHHMQLFVESNEVMLYCLLTLIYRAAPPANEGAFMFNNDCLLASRAAMQAHHRCLRNVQKGLDESWAEYINWTILSCPFTPFMVIFCHVVSSCDLEDLKILEEFVESIKRPSYGSLEALGKFFELCNAFYNLANQYVAARLRAGQNEQGQTQDFVSQTHQIPPRDAPAAMSTDLDMRLLDAHDQTAMNEPMQSGSQDQMDLSSNWFLSSTFDSWLSGDQQSLELLGGDWTNFVQAL